MMSREYNRYNTRNQNNTIYYNLTLQYYITNVTNSPRPHSATLDIRHTLCQCQTPATTKTTTTTLHYWS